MMKAAFVFPGQGSQYVGMGRDLATMCRSAREVFAQADEILGYSLSQMCFCGSREELSSTVNTQVAILTTSIACLRALQELYLDPPLIVAGHSVGEYAALVAAEALTFESAVKLVHKRARLTQRAVRPGKGKMAAVFGLALDTLERLCGDAQHAGVVEPAAVNSADQTVVSGDAEAVQLVSELAYAAGARGVIPLNVSAPFHCSLMKSAGAELRGELRLSNIRRPRVPVVANATGRTVSDPEEIERLLEAQLSNTILWRQSVEVMCGLGAEVFVEIGPRRVLSGLTKQISPGTRRVNVEDSKSLSGAASFLGQERAEEQVPRHVKESSHAE